MFFRLLALFTIIPLIELGLLIQLGRWMGILPTVLLVLGTGVLGAALARSQGLRAWQRFQSEMGRGALPTDALFDGVLILIAGAVLLTPGILTDLLGFVLLVPATRAVVRRVLGERLRRRFEPNVLVVDYKEVDYKEVDYKEVDDDVVDL